MSGATIKRARRDESPYFLMSRDLAQDLSADRLRYADLGVLAYLLSKPDDWETRVTDLIIQGAHGCGRDAIYGSLQRLRKCGYVTGREKYQDKEGRWQWTPYLVHEAPQNTEPEAEPHTGKPYTVNPEINILQIDRVQRSTKKIYPWRDRWNPKPIKALRKAKLNAGFDAINAAFFGGEGNGGVVATLSGMVLGDRVCRQSGYAPYKIEPPMTLPELNLFKEWANAQTRNDGTPHGIPTSPPTIAKQIALFRTEQADEPETQARPLAPGNVPKHWRYESPGVYEVSSTAEAIKFATWDEKRKMFIYTTERIGQ